MSETIKKNKVMKYILRGLSVFGITLLCLLVTVYSVGLIIVYGPSAEARELFVLSLSETSAAKWVPSLFMSSSAIEEIRGTSVTAADQENVEIDTTLITIPGQNNTDKPQYDNAGNLYTPGVLPEHTVSDPDDIIVSDDGITIVKVSGTTYVGDMMIIDDPSRVFVATLDAYGEEYSGLTLDGFINKYDAIGGTNAGGFVDPGGSGNGGTPDGLVVGDSQVMWGGMDYVHYCVVGFDENHIMHVGNFSGQMAMDRKLVTAVSFAPGPLLVVNGKPMNESKELGGGLNPRTAIGQRADGAILLLVVDGRQAQSLGATYDDLVDIMVSFGAVNAANLDGGSSTRMHYKGEYINNCASMIGQRALPNAILIKRKEG